MWTAPIFNHFYNQKCGLCESIPYRRINPKRNGARPTAVRLLNFEILLTPINIVIYSWNYSSYNRTVVGQAPFLCIPIFHKKDIAQLV